VLEVEEDTCNVNECIAKHVSVGL